MKATLLLSASEALLKIAFLTGMVLILSCSSDNGDDPIAPEVEPQAR